MSRLLRSLAVAVSFSLMLASPWADAQGAEFRADKVVHIKADEVIEGDLYAFGEHVTIEGMVKGDLIAAGRHIVVKGTVEGDVAAAGQSVLVEGQLGDDARLAGQAIKLAASSRTKGDVLAAGLSIELEQKGQVDGDFIVAGYQADLSGDIAGKLKGGLSNCRLAGTVGEDADLEIGGSKNSPKADQMVAGNPPPFPLPDVPGGLTIESTAKLDGKLRYSAHSEADIDANAKLANAAEFKAIEQGPGKAPPTWRETALDKLRHLACIGLLGLVMVLVLPGTSAAAADTLRRRPLASLAGGLAGIVLFWALLIALAVAVTVLAILFAVATLGELSLAVIVAGLLSGLGLAGSFWLFTLYLAPAVASLAAGRLFAASFDTKRVVVPFLIGFVVVALLLSIPYAGYAIGWLAMLCGLGALLVWLVSPREPAAVSASSKGA